MNFRLAGHCRRPKKDAIFDKLEATLDEQLRAYVVRVDRLTPTIVDVIVKAPLQARKFRPGQFYRLQNFETSAPVVDGTRLLMEGLALTGAWVDEEKGLLSMIVLEMGTSSRLCSLLKEGEEVLVMGPTGTPTEIPQNETVLLAGGGLGNAVLFSIARALKANNNHVVYFAGYKNGRDLLSVKRSKRRPIRSFGRPTRARRSVRCVRRIRTFAAISCRRWSVTPKGNLARPVSI
jgi:NAD(P)H-flavin reductase